MNQQQLLGARGEQAAADYLCAHGYRILERNWRCKIGELDLIVADANDFVLAVEVKTRSTNNFGTGFDAITPSKYRRLQRLLLAWGKTRGRYVGQLRIDIIEVYPQSGGYRCQHHEQVAS